MTILYESENMYFKKVLLKKREEAISSRRIVALQKGIEIKHVKCYNVHSEQNDVFCNLLMNC